MTIAIDAPLLDGQPVKAGIYDIPEETYFGASWALSCSGCKLLLPPSCPAKFFYRQDHQEYKTAWDFGSGAHKLVLGSGPEIVELEYDDWKKVKAREQRDEARAEGKTPLLTKELAIARAMAAALEEHPLAWNLLDPEHGRAEQSVFWRDERTGQWCRCRIDWMYEAFAPRIVVVDYKSADSADPDKFAKACADYGYHQQHALYADGLAAVTGAAVDFWFIVQEKTAPYLVNVIELIPDAVRIGRNRNNRAIDIYRTCIATGEWPAYGDGISEIALPAWASREDSW
jgi:hypothetical protein